jgi:hypothetical protein
MFSGEKFIPDTILYFSAFTAARIPFSMTPSPSNLILVHTSAKDLEIKRVLPLI